jgi:hypothetical protein
MAEALVLGESFSLGELEFVAASVFDREGEISVPAKK